MSNLGLSFTSNTLRCSRERKFRKERVATKYRSLPDPLEHAIRQNPRGIPRQTLGLPMQLCLRRNSLENIQAESIEVQNVALKCTTRSVPRPSQPPPMVKKLIIASKEGGVSRVAGVIRPSHTLSVSDRMINESPACLMVQKPASRTCAAAESPEYRDGPEEDFWATSSGEYRRHRDIMLLTKLRKGVAQRGARDRNQATVGGVQLQNQKDRARNRQPADQ